MRMFFATLTIALLLVASIGNLNAAQETEQKTEKGPVAQQMPTMMGEQGGMMCGAMGKGMMGQMGNSMMCPMCGQMMQGGMMGRGMMAQKRVDLPNAQTFLALADELKLKDEQIKSLKNISLNSQKAAIRKTADLSIARIELNALLGQEKIDLEQVQQKVKQAANLGAELQIARIEASIKAKKVLRDEQLALFKEITKKRVRAEKKPAAQKARKEQKPKRRAAGYEAHH